MVSITLGCASYISGDLSRTALGFSTLIGVESRMMGPLMGLIVDFLVYKGSPKLLEKVLTALVAVMAIVFVTTMFVAKPGVGEILSGCIPRIPDKKFALYNCYDWNYCCSL